MSVVAVVAGKGAPGATTTAVVLAAVWPRPAVVAECDPAGGDLVFRLRGDGGAALAGDRGVVSLATAARGGVSAALLGQHTQVAAGGLPLLVGVAGEAQAAGLASAWPAVARAFTVADGSDVLVDCGRLSPATPLPLLRAADVVVLVCRASPESVAHTGHAVARIAAECAATPVVAVIGDGAAVPQVSAALRGCGELDVLGPLADDPRAAAGLAGQWTPRLDRTRLVDTARTMARALDTRLAARAAANPRPADSRCERAVVSGVW